MIGLILFSLAGAAGGIFFFDFITRDIGRATTDFLFSIIWVSGFIFLLFHAVQVMAWDNERGSVHTLMARPISRSEYALALYLGLACLLFLLNVVLGGICWGVLSFVKKSVAIQYFEVISSYYFFLALAGLYAIQLMILAIILLFSSAIRGSLPVLLLTLCYYIICSALPVVRASLQNKIILGYNDSLDALLKWCSALFPDYSWLDFKSFVASNDPGPTLTQVSHSFIYSMLYLAIVLWLATAIYERRDLQ
jgi:ABC-type transport system involved in multi-copper enzyme maturation permease subunit